MHTTYKFLHLYHSLTVGAHTISVSVRTLAALKIETIFKPTKGSPKWLESQYYRCKQERVSLVRFWLREMPFCRGHQHMKCVPVSGAC